MRALARRRGHDPSAPPALGSSALAARAVALQRGARSVLAGVDLDVAAGELLALVGPNGAGKSSLLGVLAGDEPAHAGTVQLLGRPVHTWSPSQAARRRSVLPQHNTLSFPFAVREVVAMGRAPWRGTAEAAADPQVISEVMAEADVTELAQRRFTSLSGGEAARVSLARVLAQRCPVLLLDEPSAALDPHYQERVFTLLRRRASADDAVVVVVHELNLAAAYADRVAVLAEGSIRAVGPPAQVLTDEILSAAYGHAMEVVAHPRTSLPTIMPRR